MAETHNRPHSLGIQPGLLHLMANLHTAQEMFAQLSQISGRMDTSNKHSYPRGKTDVNPLKYCLGVYSLLPK